ncbi:MAG: hypothetical protein ACREK9_04465 [Candidatus Rokuibacteriota bacterium]
MRPPFAFILADGVSYAALRRYRGRLSCSPELNATAVEGLRFTDGSSNSLFENPDRPLAIVKGGVFDKRAL